VVLFGPNASPIYASFDGLLVIDLLGLDTLYGGLLVCPLSAKGLIQAPIHGWVDINASKFAVVSFTESVRGQVQISFNACNATNL
jgi:hypothetical protein